MAAMLRNYRDGRPRYRFVIKLNTYPECWQEMYASFQKWRVEQFAAGREGRIIYA